jgi:hypothetical protein
MDRLAEAMAMAGVQATTGARAGQMQTPSINNKDTDGGIPGSVDSSMGDPI